MFILRLIQFLSLILIVLAFLTQILIPIIKGTKLFPFFNDKRSKILKEIKTIREEQDVQELELELEHLKKETQTTSKGDKQ